MIYITGDTHNIEDISNVSASNMKLCCVEQNADYSKTWASIQKFAQSKSSFGPFNHDLITMMREPVTFSPDSLKGQLEYIQKYWDKFLGEWLKRILTGMDAISEEEKDYATRSMLTWFIDEQVEEEENAQEYIDHLKLIGDNGYGLYQLDKELAARVYNVPSPLATAK